MPSGFQQDSNQLQPALFRVVIDMSNNTYDVYQRGTGSGTALGLINPYTWDNFSGEDRPTTVNNALRLARGNIRWQRIVEELGRHSDVQILDLEVSNLSSFNGDDLPTQIAFTAKYDRFGINLYEVDPSNPFYTSEDDSPLLEMEVKYIRAERGLTINDSANSPYDNEHINNTYEAVQEAIMRALIKEVTRSVRVFVPVEGSSPLVGSGSQQKVTAYDITDEGSYGTLRNSISVSLLDGSTVINP
jgi:hypothetical protein